MSNLKHCKLAKHEHVLYDSNDGQILCYCKTKAMVKLIKLGLSLITKKDLEK